MTGGGVPPNEMNETPDFDDATTESLLGGRGHAADPDLARLLGDLKSSFTSTPPAVSLALAELIGATAPAATPSPRRFERMRASVLAKAGATVAALFAATGALGVAHALPAPVQDAVSHLGIGSPAHSAPKTAETGTEVDETTTTMDPSVTTTTVVDESPGTGDTTPTSEVQDNHGGEVSSIAHDGNTGCEHGHTVAGVASDSRSKAPDCPTPTSEPSDGQDAKGENHSHDNGGDGETSTTFSAGNTPTTVAGGDHSGGDHHRGGGNSGD